MRRVAFFCIFVDLLNIRLNRRWLDSPICFCLPSVISCLAEENSTSHGDMVRTERSVLWPFMGLCFKVSCHVESETIGVNFSFSVTLTHCILCIGLFCTVTGSFNHAWFCSIKYWSLEKYWFTDLGRSSKCWHINYKHQKFTFVNIATNLIRKVLKDWEAGKLRMANTSFPEF